ncbi:MAG: TerD family protein [Candidatus Contendobacter sp.]|jgi:stress response protein SCP2|nr:TerD family protein [Gammaproteobacteria bacterium]MCC8992578.1 TerD family protein [Candidatus Contendobacter sp.]
MKELIKGANAPLAASGRVQIRLLWNNIPGELDFACFALDAHDRVLADDWFVFYNQPASPGDAIRIDPDRPAFLINLDALPGAVRKCIFTATLSSGTFQAMTDAIFIAAPTAGDYAVRFRLVEPIESRSLLVAELYRYNGAWKVRAKGEGLKANLAELSRQFGVDVLDETPSLRHPPATPSSPQPRPINRPITPLPLPPSRVLPTTPVPVPITQPPSAPLIPIAPSSTPPAHGTGQPTPPPLDRHEKLKTYATLAIAFGSLTTAITTLIALLITQCHR